MKKVLLTGSRGFLGRHLIKKLEFLNFVVYESNTSVANLFDYSNLKIYKKIKFDYIIHLAAKTDRKSTRLNSSHVSESRMPSSA